MGLGPGDPAAMSGQARAALEAAEVVLGYKTYVDLVRPLISGKKIETSGMTRELDRAGRALDLALSGVPTALVSGGDPGIYAMAGVVFELVKSRGLDLGVGPGRVEITVVPGIPALAAAAALLGAPLTHDFAAVSLSDRLTPWEVIAKRLDLASQADFVIVLYNPKSKGRDWQFGRACEIMLANRDPETPVGVVQKAMRDGQQVSLTTLGQATQADIDMQTVVVVGNSHSFTWQGRLVTPRGYIRKYGEASETD